MIIDELKSWIGRSETSNDAAVATSLNALAATLGDEASIHREGDEVPPLCHWTYFLPCPRQSQLGQDGHPLKGGFRPPMPLPQRMWAGSQIEFRRPLHVGDVLSRTSTISDVSLKEGRTGPLAFIKLRHEVSNANDVAIVEQRDIVDRDPPTAADGAKPTAAPSRPTWARLITPSPTLLFRYSALTFNSHRIHYDRPCAEGVEGYGGLVVHGPLIATLLLDLLRQALPEARVTEFSFRAVRPLTDTSSFSVCGDQQDDGCVRLWAQDAARYLATTATARVA